jgi:NAD(P)-dependent dehydrogenase (short-subunit alcohol dehydrogenase family)
MESTPRRLEGKRALVTGGSSGIGRAISEAFVREGAEVVIASRDSAKGGTVAIKVGATAHLACDLAAPDQIERMAGEAAQILGRIDILVNNAGASPFGSLLEPDLDTFREAFDTNVKGPYLLTGLVAKEMADRGAGKVVSVTTMTTAVGVPGVGAYSASKAALASLTQTWAAELGPRGVNVNAVAPGPIPTPMTAAINDAQEEFASHSPAGRRGRPEDIANAVLFLASDEADYIHGVELMVDGGYVIV